MIDDTDLVFKDVESFDNFGILRRRLDGRYGEATVLVPITFNTGQTPFLERHTILVPDLISLLPTQGGQRQTLLSHLVLSLSTRPITANFSAVMNVFIAGVNDMAVCVF
jgi:hypothetical protein